MRTGARRIPDDAANRLPDSEPDRACLSRGRYPRVHPLTRLTRLLRPALGALALAVAMTAGPLQANAAGGGGDGPRFIALDPIQVPVSIDGRVKGNITLALKLDLLDPGYEENVRRFMPKLRDSFIALMYRYGSSPKAQKTLELDAIMNAFQAMADEAFGKDRVKVLVDSVGQTSG
jgi:hypothetical protein